jgi:hypothetical protein
MHLIAGVDGLHAVLNVSDVCCGRRFRVTAAGRGGMVAFTFLDKSGRRAVVLTTVELAALIA